MLDTTRDRRAEIMVYLTQQSILGNTPPTNTDLARKYRVKKHTIGTDMLALHEMGYIKLGPPNSTSAVTVLVQFFAYTPRIVTRLYP